MSKLTRHKAARHDSVPTAGSAVPVATPRGTAVLLQILPELALDGTPQLLVDELVDAGRVPVPGSEALPAARAV